MSFEQGRTETGCTGADEGADTWLFNRVLNSSLDFVGLGTVDNNVDRTDFEAVELFIEFEFLTHDLSMFPRASGLSTLISFESKRLFNSLSE